MTRYGTALLVLLASCGAGLLPRVTRDAPPAGYVLGAWIAPPARGRSTLRGVVRAIDEQPALRVHIEGEGRTVTLAIGGEHPSLPFGVGDALAWTFDCSQPGMMVTCSVTARDDAGLVFALLRGPADPIAPELSADWGDAIGTTEGACGRSELHAVRMRLDGSAWTIDRWGGWSPHDVGATRYWIQARASRLLEVGCTDTPTSSFEIAILRALDQRS